MLSCPKATSDSAADFACLQASGSESRPTLLVSKAAQRTVGEVAPAASTSDRAQAGQAACSAGWRLLPCSTGHNVLRVVQDPSTIAVLFHATP